jgi:hypothetical protein
MHDRAIALISGTGFLCFWLGYKAAKLANGLPLQLTAMDGLSLVCSGLLIHYGVTGRPGTRVPPGRVQAADGGGDDGTRENG